MSTSRQIAPAQTLDVIRSEIATRRPAPASAEAPSQLYVLCRSMAQLEGALAWKPAHDDLPALSMVYCEFEDVRRYKDAIALARSARVPIALATLRIIKPHEHGLLRQLADCAPDAILIRNLAGLSFFGTHAPTLPLIADYALNVANELTADLIASHGVVRMTPSYDLSWKQMKAMFGRISPALFEAVIHQHMPMFHMEHCVFCHTLSNGTDYRDCGRPCESHAVDLRDRAGEAHPLVADIGCRNTVYNASAQSAAQYVPQMQQIGLRHFRVELLRERREEVGPILSRYAGMIAGRVEPKEAIRSLRVLNQLGVTAGTLGRD